MVDEWCGTIVVKFDSTRFVVVREDGASCGHSKYDSAVIDVVYNFLSDG